ncbi:unnamed protein product [Candida verbasci]|uniref:GH16 domain-containing protein n=1 Tax=Candida verbasci TaxID=1227364 RepID=A0A9W4TXS9_9ASCO|nr:unnamed protein product [Candida verbasci]
MVNRDLTNNSFTGYNQDIELQNPFETATPLNESSSFDSSSQIDPLYNNSSSSPNESSSSSSFLPNNRIRNTNNNSNSNSNSNSNNNYNNNINNNNINNNNNDMNNNYNNNYNNNNHLDLSYGRPFTANIYSSNESNSQLLSSSNDSTNKFNSQNPIRSEKIEINEPPSYDRYPLINDSENNSTTTPILGNKKISSLSLNKLIDSPFGGYPANSFPLNINEKEDDDYLHNPDPIEDAKYDKNRFYYDLKYGDKKSIFGMFGFLFLIIAAALVFVLLPAITYTGVTDHTSIPESFEILTHYNYPMISGIRTTLIDPDTPSDALTIKSKNGDDWNLVFSDEFNAIGRTFYDGDDQFWTAPDLHYDATKDLEWYDPDAVTTTNGTLNLRMDAFKNHNLFYRSGMIQSWNKMCFTQGRIKISAKLPGYGTKSGLWPGMWTMGNLGRPGYLGSTEGVWPYSYNSCDSGITANQSSPDGISYLPGQRLNKCTCPGESHPNRGIGRGAPEIDVIEAEISTDPDDPNKENLGVASQSLQIAPMDIWYMPDYDFIEIYNKSVTTMNTYAGGPFQQAISGTTTLNKTWYEMGVGIDHNYQDYGFEYLNDESSGYLRWFVGDYPTVTMYSQALHPNGNIGWRTLSKEPMSVIVNLGISRNWAYIDWPAMIFPINFQIDYIRIYQPKDQINLGCDPDDFPTYDYIQQHLNIYENANLTSFEDGGYTFPTTNLTGGC